MDKSTTFTGETSLENAKTSLNKTNNTKKYLDNSNCLNNSNSLDNSDSSDNSKINGVNNTEPCTDNLKKCADDLKTCINSEAKKTAMDMPVTYSLEVQNNNSSKYYDILEDCDIDCQRENVQNLETYNLEINYNKDNNLENTDNGIKFGSNVCNNQINESKDLKDRTIFWENSNIDCEIIEKKYAEISFKIDNVLDSHSDTSSVYLETSDTSELKYDCKNSEFSDYGESTVIVDDENGDPILIRNLQNCISNHDLRNSINNHDLVKDPNIYNLINLCTSITNEAGLQNRESNFIAGTNQIQILGNKITYPQVNNSAHSTVNSYNNEGESLNVLDKSDFSVQEMINLNGVAPQINETNQKSDSLRLLVSSMDISDTNSNGGDDSTQQDCTTESTTMDFMKKSEKQYTCDVCSKKYFNLKYFNKHVESHGVVRQYNCSKCSQSFVSRNHLKIHLNTHLSDKNKYFECDVCGEKFLHRHLFKIHSYKHSSVKPYPCTKCDKGK